MIGQELNLGGGVTGRLREGGLARLEAAVDSACDIKLAPIRSQIDAIADALAKRAGQKSESRAVSIEEATQAMVHASSAVVPNLVKGTTGLDTLPRVKSVAELYRHTKSAVTYDQSDNEFLAKNWAGRQLMSASGGDGCHAIDFSSQFEKAVIGAWFKFSALCAPRDGEGLRLRLTEHDLALVNFALHEMPFAGIAGFDAGTGHERFRFNNRKLTDYERKALLDDVLSGGLEAAPIAFDDAVILTPLLHGEFFPLVNLITITRGRRMEAFQVGNPTFQWGVGEGTNVPLFNTDAFIGSFDNLIHPATGAMSMGLDFDEDSPVDVGRIVAERFGEAAKTTLDFICVLGDGITQPQGVFNASGITTVLAINGNGGPLTTADLSGLQFGLTKPYRNDRSVYISNDIFYARTRNLKVDPAGTSTDERRVLGNDFQAYTTLGYQHRIQNDIPNTKAGFVDFSRFRLYRRAGLAIRIEKAGATLALSNQQLIVCRMRFGGGMDQGGAGAIMTNAMA